MIRCKLFCLLIGCYSFLFLFSHDTITTAQNTTTTIRVSVASTGTGGNTYSNLPAISADGHMVAFFSDATNLTPLDTNGVRDIFVHNRTTLSTERVSIASNGIQSNGPSLHSALNATGRFIAFDSEATNLVADDTNGVSDIFVHDRNTLETERVSISTLGIQADNRSSEPSLSADGRFVAFSSLATNLVPEDTNGTEDIFVYDRETHQAERVSVGDNNLQSNGASGIASISGNGRYVVFYSDATNLVEGDTNGVTDVFVYDRQAHLTQRVSISSTRTQSNGFSTPSGISADGRLVVFYSAASNLVVNDTNGTTDVFTHDLRTGLTRRVSIASNGSQSNSYSDTASLAANGRFVAFNSNASNLVPTDTNHERDVFVHDLQTSETYLVSLGTSGNQGNNSSGSMALSADGRYVTFGSGASNLVSGDTNNAYDVFLREWGRSDYTVFGAMTMARYAYETCSANDREPNNRFSEALVALPICPNALLIGNASRSTDIVDIFRIEVTTSDSIQIDLTDLPRGSDYDLYLYDATYTQIAVQNHPGSQDEQIRYPATPGRYFIGVVPITDSPTSDIYHLQWTTP